MMQTSMLWLLAGNTAVAAGLAIVAWIVGRAGRPALAHVAWLLVLLKLVTPPLWSVPIGSAPSALSPPAHVTAAVAAPSAARASVAAGVSDDLPTPDVLSSDSPAARTLPRSAGGTLNPSLLLALAWAGGAAIVTGIAVVRTWRFRHVLHDGVEPDPALADEIAAIARSLGIAAPPTLVVPHAISPMLWFVGFGRPQLILPARLLDSLPADQRAGVIAHELAHLRRRDHWVRLFEWPVTMLLWFHPLVWLARHGLREAEEQCCDAWAVGLARTDRRDYANALVNTLDWLATDRPLPLGATGFGRVATMRRRLTMIVTGSPSRSLTQRSGAVAAVLLAAVFIVPVRGEGQPATQASPIPADAIHVDAGASIQAAIDQAPAGATIVVGPGTFDEALTITKPLTLIGAGWDKTIVGQAKAHERTQQEKDDFFRRLDATHDPRERQRLAASLVMDRNTQAPAVSVRNSKNVAIRGMRFRGPPTGDKEFQNNQETLVAFSNVTDGTLAECAIVGPFSNGVSATDGSSITIDHTLVAAVWGTGVQVVGSKLHLADSDIRNCYYSGLRIAADQGSVIERNRISGSAWHGIRYDNCSPTISGNIIFGVARSGIYASGKSAANVRGNVFWRNEMDGMSCWYANQDVVEGNTFVDNRREAIDVLGGSKTVLTKNIFAGSPTAVMTGGISGESETLVGAPQLTANLFSNNPKNYVTNETETPLPPGNETADPKFVARDQHNYALAADSPARKSGIGAADPIAIDSPFPLTDEEKAMVPESETRDFKAWKKPASAATEP